MKSLVDLLVDDLKEDKKQNPNHSFRSRVKGKIERLIWEKCRNMGIVVGDETYRRAQKKAEAIFNRVCVDNGKGYHSKLLSPTRKGL